MWRNNAHRGLRSVFQWHRYVGLTACLLLMMLVVTGMLLNHTEQLALDRTWADSDLLLEWYGIDAPKIDAAFRTANHWIIQVEDQIYVGRAPLDEAARSGLRGAIEASGLVAVAVDSTILLLTRSGELVEQLGDAEGVPSALRRIGHTERGRVIADAAHGLYTTDENFLTWRPYRGTERVLWPRLQSPPQRLARNLREHYRSHILPVERVVLDLHSGRILGSWGIFAVDAAAVLLFFLAFSGCWLWYERYRKRKVHRKAGAHSRK